MSKLINPGAGEITDRLMILSLKILFGIEAGKDVSHFHTEEVALLSQIRARTLNGKWFAHVPRLAAVNGMLWHAEDDLREMRKAPGGVIGVVESGRIATLAFRIQSLNDLRAEIIAGINKDAGDAGDGQKEKVSE